MYSFGRLHPSNPFFGGFVHEYIDKGTFKRFSKTVANVYSLEIEDDQFDEIKYTIHDFKTNKRDYKFNILGLFAVGFNKKVQPKNYFYCAEFIKYLLEESKVCKDLPDIIRPESFKEIPNIKLEYKGKLQDYKIQ